MKIDGMFSHRDMADIDRAISRAQFLEETGFDAVTIAEITHDPFLPLAVVARETEKIELRTSIAVAFARSPMTLANTAHDLNAMSKGRFTLGIGSQIRAHITKRFSMPWHKPAKQMRELIESINAIWDAWYDNKPLAYTGDYYQHTLMTPEFSPKNIEYGRPKIMLAAVGPHMIRTAAKVADGIIIHPFCTEDYLREVMLPNISEVLDARGKTLDDFEIQYPAFVATGETEEQFEAAKKAVKYRIGFYASTPAYQGVLDVHGWGDFQPGQRQLTKEGKWDQLGDGVTDEMLEAFAAVGEPLDAAKNLKDRFGDIIDRLQMSTDIKQETIAQQIKVVKGEA